MSEYEELNAKAYIQGLKDGKEIGRADAIDEFAEKLCDKVCDDVYKTMVRCSDGTFIECDIWTLDSLVDLIFDSAEQLKEQNK